MAEEPSHIKQLSLNYVCKIGLKIIYSGTRRSVFQMIVADISCCDHANIGNQYSKRKKMWQNF
jgi:hypothetical protein